MAGFQTFKDEAVFVLSQHILENKIVVFCVESQTIHIRPNTYIPMKRHLVPFARNVIRGHMVLGYANIIISQQNLLMFRYLNNFRNNKILLTSSLDKGEQFFLLNPHLMKTAQLFHFSTNIHTNVNFTEAICHTTC